MSRRPSKPGLMSCCSRLWAFLVSVFLSTRLWRLVFLLQQEKALRGADRLHAHSTRGSAYSRAAHLVCLAWRSESCLAMRSCQALPRFSLSFCSRLTDLQHLV